MSARVDMIAGLGNPGSEYANTRHNAGFWFVDEVVRKFGGNFKYERKFQGDVARSTIKGHQVWLLKPDTFMNLSGQAVLALMQFYKIKLENILVVHDDLDLPVGTLKLKLGGGHGGHNGLRDIISRCGGNGFQRIRLGIGHPGNKDKVTGHVLKKASRDDQIAIENVIDQTITELDQIVHGEISKAMQTLHTK
ncbi:Peptidyl-tRNA hydrolase [hydrothermal vent metagenome]|uniref:peptidyl-tRNA hydrolase n=1 Tax=hydrothermal vent metagenome TaxID=652676 RepID=A0A3B0ZKC5_9ZZZZ